MLSSHALPFSRWIEMMDLFFIHADKPRLEKNTSGLDGTDQNVLSISLIELPFVHLSAFPASILQTPFSGSSVCYLKDATRLRNASDSQSTIVHEEIRTFPTVSSETDVGGHPNRFASSYDAVPR